MVLIESCRRVEAVGRSLRWIHGLHSEAAQSPSGCRAIVLLSVLLKKRPNGSVRTLPESRRLSRNINGITNQDYGLDPAQPPRLNRENPLDPLPFQVPQSCLATSARSSRPKSPSIVADTPSGDLVVDSVASSVHCCVNGAGRTFSQFCFEGVAAHISRRLVLASTLLAITKMYLPLTILLGGRSLCFRRESDCGLILRAVIQFFVSDYR
jgi:hypothetical protein